MRITSKLACIASFAAIIFLSANRQALAQQTALDGGVIVDSTDHGYSEGGTWKDINTWDLIGQSYSPVRETDDPQAWAKWTTTLPAGGKYRVYFWHVPCSDADTKIEIVHMGHADTFQRSVAWGHMAWTSLGDFDFAPGETASVKFTHGSKVLAVNSVKFLPVANIKPLAPLPSYPKADGSFPRIDPSGNLMLSGHPYQMIYQELYEETTAHSELIATNFDETFDLALSQGVNTLGTTIYWRTFEKTPGVYDFTIIDALIEKARARNMHLSLILFFAWRNLQSYYLPQYIAKDHNTYLFDKLSDGTEDPHRKVSPFSDATRAVETKALTALFKRVLEKDPDHQVVLMAQIENEMPGPRDYSAPAQAMWNKPVPQPLIDALKANEGTINRIVWRAWNKHGRKTSGTWAEVFGDDNTGGRIFGVWAAGCYIQPLVTDLKKIIDIPFYMNAWIGESPATYQYMDVFHASAPVLDGMGPDAYGPFSKWETNVALSVRSWNHLVIPEQGHSAEAMWRAIGNYNALISGQWETVEGIDWLNCRETYGLITAMSPLIASKRGTGGMMGFFQAKHAAGESWSEYFQDLKITYTALVPNHLPTTQPKKPTPTPLISNVHLGELDGCGMLIALGNGEYVLTSTRIDLTLSYINGGPISVTDAQAGHFENGEWVSTESANVDQQGEAVHFHFPGENRHYGQIRFKLSSTAHNPARVFEVERGNMIGAVEPIYDVGASGDLCVNGFRGDGNGVQIPTSASFPAAGVTIRYACHSPSKATISVDGKNNQEIAFSATGSDNTWSTKSISLNVPVGAAVSIQTGRNMSAPALDCILLSRDAVAKPATQPATMP